MQNRSIKDLLVGALVGIVSMLPGSSGATVAVIFGIYERLISDLANIRSKLLKDLRFIVPLGLGVVLGMFACAVGLDFLIENTEIPMMFFFAALIVCQVPTIHELGKDDVPTTPLNILALIVGFTVMIVFLFTGTGEGSEEMASPAIMFVVGIIVAVSKLAPGISGSTVLLALGLFTPFMEAFANLDIMALIPVGLGLIVGVLVFSRIINFFMEHNRKSTYYAILGLTIGSIVTVTVQAIIGMDADTMLLGSIAGIIAGVLIGILLNRVSRGYAMETAEQSELVE